ncbi:unnamed protein product [Symbiodinium sp. CCMP2592]|nr:unnamed protein product [Symbiodinium sp. CCMP2592]
MGKSNKPAKNGQAEWQDWNKGNKPSRYWRGSWSAWERSSWQQPQDQGLFPAYDGQWSEGRSKAAITILSESRAGPSEPSVLKDVQFAVNQVRKADARRAKVEKEREDKIKRWAIYTQELQSSFIAEKQRHLDALDNFDQEVAAAARGQEIARAALGKASDGFLTKGQTGETEESGDMEWDAMVEASLRAQRPYTREDATKDLADIFGADSLLKEPSQTKSTTPSGRPAEDAIAAGPVRAYAGASPRARVDPYLAASPASFMRERPIPATAPPETAAPEASAQTSAGMPPAATRSASRCRTPVKQLPQQPVHVEVPGGPSLADKLHVARRTALAPFGLDRPAEGANSRSDAVDPPPAEMRPPDQINLVEEELNAASPGLTRME